MQKEKSVYIGTSGWSYRSWSGKFYPQNLKPKDYLAYYSKYFDTVEINSSFYHALKDVTVQNWEKSVPDGFLFAVKADRYITHMKKLENPSETVPEFIKTLKSFKRKSGPILFQLPPSFAINPERLEAFLKILPSGYPYVFEFRNKSWFVQEIYNILKKFNAGLCIYNLAGFQSPKVITSDFVYIRLHGTNGLGSGKYSDEELLEISNDIKNYKSQGKDVYCYFNNDGGGFAVENAFTLKKDLNIN